MINKYDTMYMKMAQLLAAESRDERLKVGCIFVKDNRIIVEGLNGTLRGSKSNECQDEYGNSSPDLIHAEGNAIQKAARLGLALDGSTLYVTHQCCESCARQVIGVGVVEVVWGMPYKCQKGVGLLEQFNVKHRRVLV